MSRLRQRLGLPRYEADEHFKLALQAFDRRDLDQAIDNMDKAIAILPTRAEYYATRGYFFLEDGLPEKAAPDFEEALKHYRFEMLAHYGLGVIAYKRRDYDAALEHFTNAYAAQPDRPEVLYYLALVHHRKRENLPALNYMRQAEAIYEKNNDKRSRDAKRWVREIEKLAE